VVVDFLKVSESSCCCEGGGQGVTIEAIVAVTVEVGFLDSGWIAAATEGSGDTNCHCARQNFSKISFIVISYGKLSGNLRDFIW